MFNKYLLMSISILCILLIQGMGNFIVLQNPSLKYIDNAPLTQFLSLGKP